VMCSAGLVETVCEEIDRLNNQYFSADKTAGSTLQVER
jgi:hypothetical protein